MMDDDDDEVAFAAAYRILKLYQKRYRKCGAKTRKGSPCQRRPHGWKQRCPLHGGLSTGPRTTDGRQRIAEAQRRRWARWRAEKAGTSK